MRNKTMTAWSCGHCFYLHPKVNLQLTNSLLLFFCQQDNVMIDVGGYIYTLLHISLE